MRGPGDPTVTARISPPAGMARESGGTLRPVTFEYKQPYEDGTKPVQYRLVAEEVAVLAKLVRSGDEPQIVVSAR